MNDRYGSVADTRDYRSSNAYRLHLSIPEIVDTSERRENAQGGVLDQIKTIQRKSPTADTMRLTLV